MSDRTPVLEWEQDDCEEWFAQCGGFGLHVRRYYDFYGRTWYSWRISTPESADAGNQGQSHSLPLAQLAAEDWLRSACEEAARLLREEPA